MHPCRGVNIWRESLCPMDTKGLSVQKVHLRTNPLLDSLWKLLLLLEPPAEKEMSRFGSEIQMSPVCLSFVCS